MKALYKGNLAEAYVPYVKSMGDAPLEQAFLHIEDLKDRVERLEELLNQN